MCKFSNKICKASNVYLFAWSSICQNQTKLLFANAKEGCLEGGFVEHALMTLKLLDFLQNFAHYKAFFLCFFLLMLMTIMRACLQNFKTRDLIYELENKRQNCIKIQQQQTKSKKKLKWTTEKVNYEFNLNAQKNNISCKIC